LRATRAARRRARPQAAANSFLRVLRSAIFISFSQSRRALARSYHTPPGTMQRGWFDTEGFIAELIPDCEHELGDIQISPLPLRTLRLCVKRKKSKTELLRPWRPQIPEPSLPIIPNLRSSAFICG
jgi:hypothetical protein